MNKKMEPWQEEYIRHNAHSMTAPQLVRATGLTRSCVYSFLTAQNIKYKPTKYHAKDKTIGDILNRKGRRGAYSKWSRIDDQLNEIKKISPVPYKRPSAQYSNHSPLGIADQYR